MSAELPHVAQQFRQRLRAERQQDGSPIGKVVELATEIEKSAAEAAGPSAAPSGVTRVQVEEKPLDVRSYLWKGGMGALAGGSEAVVLLFLIYFLLASGDVYRRKLVAITGPSLSRMKVTVAVLAEISDQLQWFLILQVVLGALVAALSWLAFWWVGLAQPLVWGLAAGVLNTIPYFGPAVVSAVVAVVAFVQFGTFTMAASVAALAAAITGLEGFLLTPWLLGRAARMNEGALFVSLLFWGWMWGPVGILLAMPIMMTIKTICGRVERLAPVAEVLGD